MRCRVGYEVFKESISGMLGMLESSLYGIGEDLLTAAEVKCC